MFNAYHYYYYFHANCDALIKLNGNLEWKMLSFKKRSLNRNFKDYTIHWSCLDLSSGWRKEMRHSFKVSLSTRFSKMPKLIFGEQAGCWQMYNARMMQLFWFMHLMKYNRFNDNKWDAKLPNLNKYLFDINALSLFASIAQKRRQTLLQTFFFFNWPMPIILQPINQLLQDFQGQPQVSLLESVG